MIDHIEAVYINPGAYIAFPQGWDWLKSSQYAKDNVHIVLYSEGGLFQIVQEFDRIAVDTAKSRQIA